ncbi:hypothetical protein CBF34_08375 [Vagococcus penaei]|uniref:Uncharacterized protein n=2 Tax=Vagococcus penaei TaxID=633807 RepID=A0A1Q2D622_9ENTE|nr:hypothetical protein BW732_05655 [Vagococcus penaei]RSU00395.1 hypothetical protein CBF34_08375 [Vagococcus penaei]
MEKSPVSACKESLFTIGQVAKFCGVSRKALRFYEELGIIKPDRVCPETGYRYYNHDTMMLIPIIKYYKQMGFKLQEMTGVGEKGTCFYHEKNFVTKLDELAEEERRIRNCHIAVQDWLKLIREGSMVSENKIEHVSIKYLDRKSFYYQDQEFSYDYKKSVINVPWVNYLESHDACITGAVYLRFPSYQDKLDDCVKHVSIMQEPIGTTSFEIPRWEFGGYMVASAYHVGPHCTLHQTYSKILAWMDQCGYERGEESYERYVIDYWATQETNDFVTEILIPIKANNLEKKY